MSDPRHCLLLGRVTVLETFPHQRTPVEFSRVDGIPKLERECDRVIVFYVYDGCQLENWHDGEQSVHMFLNGRQRAVPDSTSRTQKWDFVLLQSF
jgi:hypothetical protein